MQRIFRWLALVCIALLTFIDRGGGDLVANERNEATLANRRWSANLLTKANIGGREYLAWVDTGNTRSLIQSEPGSRQFNDYELREVFVRDGVTGGRIKQRAFFGVPVATSGCPEMPLDIVEMDLTLFSNCKSWGINAAIGMDYLRHVVLYMEGSERGMTIQTSSRAKHRGYRVPVSIRSGAPYVTISLPGGFSVECVVDTGQDFLLTVSPELARQLGRFGHSVPAPAETGLTAQGAVKTPTHVIRWIEFANVRFNDIQVCESQRPAIGLALLEHFDCVFDFPRQEAWLSPLNDGRIVRIEPDASGLFVGYEPDGRAVILRVEQDYPAGRTRIAKGDELITLNGRKVRELSYREVARALSCRGTRVMLVLKHAQSTYAVDLRLDRPFEYPPRWTAEDLVPKAKFLPDDN